MEKEKEKKLKNKLRMIVCIKQVPDTNKIKVDKEHGTLIRDNLQSIVNPDDFHALEVALQLKEQYGGHISVLTMGPHDAKDAIYECIALGADKGYLVTSEHFRGADTYATTRTLLLAIERLRPFDLILMGVETLDGNTGQVPYQVSQALKIPLITQINSLEIPINEITKDVENIPLIIDRIKGHEKQDIKVHCPVIITANKHTNSVRYANLANVNHTYENEVIVWTDKDFDIDVSNFGLSGSPTKVLNVYEVVHKRGNKEIEGTRREKADRVIEILINKNVFDKVL